MRAIGMESDYDENSGNCKCLSEAYGPQLCKIGKLIKKKCFCFVDLARERERQMTTARASKLPIYG